MIDVISATCIGYQVGALSKWAINAEDPLSGAIADFPKRGILVRHMSSASSRVFIPVLYQRSAVPAWAWNYMCRIPNKRWRQLCDSDKIMADVKKNLS